MNLTSRDIEAICTLAREAQKLRNRLAECRALLRSLAEYVGGSDSPPGHPAREAWEYLKELDARET